MSSHEPYDDEQPLPLYLLPEEGDRDEEHPTPGERYESGARNPHHEEWRPHDRRGRYGQQRRRRN